MSQQWFEIIERHPAKVILGYTFAVAAAMWAISTFLLDERKFALYRAEKDNAETLIETYKAKIGVLESDNAQLRAERDRYLTWLMSEPKSLPALERKIAELEKARHTPGDGRKANTQDFAAAQLAATQQVYAFAKELKLGETFVDPRTAVTVGIAAINEDYTADVHVHVPKERGRDYERVKPGTGWDAEVRETPYRVTIEKINWLNNTAEVSIYQVRE